VYRKIDRDLDYEKDIIEREEYFWQEYVQKRTEPPYTENGNLVLESIKKKYGGGDISAPAVNLDGSISEILEKYLELRNRKLDLDHQADDIEDEMKRVYAPVLDLMGTTGKAVCQSASGEYTVTYNASYRESINKEKLEVLKVFNPDIYDKYVSRTKIHKFAVKKRELDA
jgi:predicted phage-related endonuclease